jgi:hypothetical protein
MHRVPERSPRRLADPFFDIGGVLMDANGRAVDHLQIAVVSLGNGFENPVPHTDLPPTGKAVVTGCCRPIALRNIGSGRTRPEPPIDAVEHLPVVGPRNAARLVRQEWFDNRPFEIRQFVAARLHLGSSIEELESLFATKGNPLYEFVT